MQLIIAQTIQQQGIAAAELIAPLVRANPRFVLGIATGASPLPVYAQLAADQATEFGRTTCFALDEYVGLPGHHPQSYRQFVTELIGNPLGIPPERLRVPGGVAVDLDAECLRFEEEIDRAGGIDLQILGIGRNGHLAFNEPGSEIDSRTRVVPLTDDTRQVNARFFEDPSAVPTHALTQGLGTILAARKLVLLVSGPDKAAALTRAIEGPVSTNCPASVIQLHPDVTIIADPRSVGLLRKTEFSSKINQQATRAPMVSKG